MQALITGLFNGFESGNHNEQEARIADAVKAQLNTAEQGARAARDGISKRAEFRDHATEHSQQTLRTGIEAASSIIEVGHGDGAGGSSIHTRAFGSH